MISIQIENCLLFLLCVVKFNFDFMQPDLKSFVFLHLPIYVGSMNPVTDEYDPNCSIIVTPVTNLIHSTNG